MPTPQQTLDLERVLRSIDARAAVVILVGEHGELDMASSGIDNDAALFDVTFSVAQQLAQEIFDELPEHTRKTARLILPTAEDARRLGMFHRTT